MAGQLDILALEPFFGGPRRQMLETVIRCSKHRWTLLKLPPRRIERRLTAAAIWFAEQLSRHWSGRVDVLFTSEALNLADLYRLVPALLRKPSVVYFHSNQLPDARAKAGGELDLINLNTATAATEIWFNSLYHLKTFLTRAAAAIARHEALAARSPYQEMCDKSQLVLPPIDFSAIHQTIEANNGNPPPREHRRIFVETRDADVHKLNAAFAMLKRRGELFDLITVGPVEELSEELKRVTLPESDNRAHVKAMLSCGLFVSGRVGAPADHHAVNALAAGCWPVVPRHGVYPELLPPALHESCLFDGSHEQLASRIMDAWHTERPKGFDTELGEILSY